MPITELHEMHKRRKSRNVGLGVSLGAFVILAFCLALIKLPTVSTGAAPTEQTVSK